MTSKNNRQISEKSVIRKLSLSSIAGNTFLSAFKIFAGIYGHSGAMISDAIHSFSDVLTTFIAFIGVKISKKEADKAHPYGHERVECVASLLLGLLLFVTGVGVGKIGVEKIISGEYKTIAAPGLIALIAAVVSIAVKEIMFRYTCYYAKAINSAAFMADAWHHRSDALSSIGSLIGIGGAMLGYSILDSVASVVICVFIIKVAFDILKDAISKMMDTSCDEAFERELKDFIERQDDVEKIDILRTRKFGNKIYIDLEIQVDGQKTISEGHGVAERVHSNVENTYPDIKHIMIHVNPANHNAV